MSGLHKLDRPEILSMMFHPRRVNRSAPPPEATDMDIMIAPDITIGCRFFSTDTTAPVIVFFHGNGEVAADYDDIGSLYVQQGLNFLVTDYRGYGWSDGTPSASSLLSDAGILYEKTIPLLQDQGYTGKIFLMGRSLGSACAIDLAARYQENISGLIIESGFAETLPLMRTMGLDLSSMGINEEDCFNNAAKIQSVTLPTYILHGQRDTLIPLSHAERLHSLSAARSKELQIVPGADHNSLIAVTGVLYFQAIRHFVDKVTGAENWRERRKRYKRQS